MRPILVDFSFDDLDFLNESVERKGEGFVFDFMSLALRFASDDSLYGFLIGDEYVISKGPEDPIERLFRVDMD